jgi:FkbM family methyltransferase
VKKLLKYLRKQHFISRPVGAVARGFLRFSDNTRRTFHKHWPVSGTVNLLLPGNEKLVLWSKGDDYISTQAYWKGFKGYEDTSVWLFYHLAKHSNVIIDAGANIGYFSLIAAKANPGAQVFAFEPMPDIVARFEKNRQLNNLQNISIQSMAVGETDGKIILYTPIAPPGVALAVSAKEGWLSNTTTSKAKVTTLDTWCRQNQTGKTSLVKIDCELFEDAVLRGMAAILEKDKPVLLVEILFPESTEVGNTGKFSNYQEIESLLKKHGYTFYLINSSALVQVDHLIYNPDCRNYLFSAKPPEKRYLPYANLPDLVKQLC